MGGFAAQMQAKQASNPVVGLGSSGGMFGKYKFNETHKKDENF